MQKNKRSLIAGSIGTIIEMYDLSVYGYMAVFISANFFSNLSTSLALVNTFAVFFIGFITRPLGAIAFGWVGDYLGRKRALLISIFLMAIATAVVGFLPTYYLAGVLAVVLLIVARLFQGISVGGEYIGSVIYLYEIAPLGKKTFFSSFVMMGSNLGMLLASGICLLFTKMLTHQQMLSFGWRFPFILALLGGIAGLLIRSSISETEEFIGTKVPIANEVPEKSKITLRFSLSFLLTCVGVMVTYIVYVYMPTYLHVYQGIALKKVLSVNTLSVVLLVLLIPVCGYMAEKLKRNRIFYIGLTGVAVLIVTYIAILKCHELFLAALLQCLITIFCACYFSTAPALIVALFKAKVRYSLASFSYNLSAAVFGGTIPLACSWLIKETGGFLLMGLLLICLVIVTRILFIFQQKNLASHSDTLLEA